MAVWQGGFVAGPIKVAQTRATLLTGMNLRRSFPHGLFWVQATPSL